MRSIVSLPVNSVVRKNPSMVPHGRGLTPHFRGCSVLPVLGNLRYLFLSFY